VLQFKKYYKSEEELCTFNNPGERLKKNHVFWIIKKNIDEINHQ
jgi:hypothetical protein